MRILCDGRSYRLFGQGSFWLVDEDALRCKEERGYENASEVEVVQERKMRKESTTSGDLKVTPPGGDVTL
jgi:hypothetical protein